MAIRLRDYGRGRKAYRGFVMQKQLIKKHYDCFECSMAKRRLTCIGEICPAKGCATYKIRISYEPGGEPKVHVLDPVIPRSEKIHMYRDESLCLYHPYETPWRPNDNIHEKIIPWTSEWLLFYELYLLKGEWLGKSYPHDLPN